MLTVEMYSEMHGYPEGILPRPLTPIMHVGYIIYQGSAWGADYTGSGSG